MKIKYFQDTDTLHIEFRAKEVAETKDLDENTLLDLDSEGQICAIHDRTRLCVSGLPNSINSASVIGLGGAGIAPANRRFD